MDRKNIKLEDQFRDVFLIENISKFLNSNDANKFCKDNKIKKGRLLSFCRRYNISYIHFLGKSKNLSPGREILLKHINDGLTNHQIEKIYNINNPILKRWYKEEGIKRRPYDGRLKDLPKDFLDYYNNEFPSAKDICGKYKVSVVSARKWMRELNLKPKCNSKMEIPPKHELIGTTNELSMKFDVAPSTILKWLKYHKIQPIIINSGKSKSEKELLTFINSISHYKFESSFSILNNKRLQIDCYNKDLKIGFEYNGLFWHSYNYDKRNKDKHFRKASQALEKGIRLLSIFENDWISNKEEIKGKIRKILENDLKFPEDDEILIDLSWNDYNLEGFKFIKYLPPKPFYFLLSNPSIIYEEKIEDPKCYEVFDCGYALYRRIRN